jgi:hypothetical protein
LPATLLETKPPLVRLLCMELFRLRNRTEDERARKIYAIYELAYTTVDFIAGLSFLTGSILFFFDGVETTARVFLVIGSSLFVAKPAIRFAREIKLAGVGDIDNLADRYKDP